MRLLLSFYLCLLIAPLKFSFKSKSSLQQGNVVADLPDLFNLIVGGIREVFLPYIAFLLYWNYVKKYEVSEE